MITIDNELRKSVYDAILAGGGSNLVLRKIYALPPESSMYISELYFSDLKYQNISILQLLSCNLYSNQNEHKLSIEVREASLKPFWHHYQKFDLTIPIKEADPNVINDLSYYYGFLTIIDHPKAHEYRKIIHNYLTENTSSTKNERSSKTVSAKDIKITNLTPSVAPKNSFIIHDDIQQATNKSSSYLFFSILCFILALIVSILLIVRKFRK